jgi:hypothetical protein
MPLYDDDQLPLRPGDESAVREFQRAEYTVRKLRNALIEAGATAPAEPSSEVKETYALALGHLDAAVRELENAYDLLGIEHAE